ncbi:MAG: hypothetical protein WCR97_04000 [Bacilli bacterium]
MSELKGQLLGLILVIAVFGVIAGALITAFQNSAKSVATKIEDTGESVIPTTESSTESNSLIKEENLLFF